MYEEKVTSISLLSVEMFKTLPKTITGLAPEEKSIFMQEYYKWWLRDSKSDDNDGYDVCCSLYDGTLYTYESIYNENVGVRPILIIEDNLLDLELYSEVVIFRYEWIVIEVLGKKIILLAKNQICKHRFNYYPRDAYLYPKKQFNSYQNSEIKKYLDNWLLYQKKKFSKINYKKVEPKDIKGIRLLNVEEMHNIPHDIIMRNVFWMNSLEKNQPYHSNAYSFTLTSPDEATVYYAPLDVWREIDVCPVITISGDNELDLYDGIETLDTYWIIYKKTANTTLAISKRPIGKSCYNQLPRDYIDETYRINEKYKGVYFNNYEDSSIHKYLTNWYDEKK